MSGFEEGLGKENARQGISVEVVGGRFLFLFCWLVAFAFAWQRRRFL
ncbi:hypothetical protein [Secundilactobacillus similis]|nr:hypothetical protein [Secundilactobacillus similis]